MSVEIFTDGACRGNPGPGGWAALLRKGTTEKMISGAEEICYQQPDGTYGCHSRFGTIEKTSACDPYHGFTIREAGDYPVD